MLQKYVMDYIPDKKLYSAVMFARKMIRGGKNPAIANTCAAKYYGVPVKDVAHHVGQAASRIKNRREK